MVRAASGVVRAAACGMGKEEWMSEGMVGAGGREESGWMEEGGRMAEGSWGIKGLGASAVMGGGDVMRAASSWGGERWRRGGRGREEDRGGAGAMGWR